MATDLAEFIGAAVGFKLLLGVTLLEGAGITAVVTWGILMLQSRGQKPLEFVVGGLLLFVAAAYIVELVFSRPHLPSLLEGALFPGLPNGDAVYLAAGVLGATVMPHVIYLHSALTQHTQDRGSVTQRPAHHPGRCGHCHDHRRLRQSGDDGDGGRRIPQLWPPTGRGA